jgi:hypothetical protein
MPHSINGRAHDQEIADVFSSNYEEEERDLGVIVNNSKES